MNLAAKLIWSILQGSFLNFTKRNTNPKISIGRMHITNKLMIAKIFFTIIVFSFRLRNLKDESVRQKEFCLLIALNMSEYNTIVTVRGMAIKRTDMIVQ